MKLLVSALLVILAFASGQQVRKGTEFVDGATPFEIRVNVIPGPGLEASLRNCSATTHAVLLNADIQPSSMTLEDAAGTGIRPFDERTREKFDRTVTAAMYSRIGPGASLALGRSIFKRKPNGKYEIRWGPYHFRDLHPGEYHARIMLESKVATVTDRATGRTKPMSGVWTGAISTSPVEIWLP